MKKFYTIFLFLLVTNWAQAQAVSACNDPAGGVQISFDYSQNCPTAPGDLSGLAEIGFHSGANSWGSVTDWNAANAVTGKNQGDDMFLVYIADPAAYYNVLTVDDYNFVFNQGPADADNPWASEGKPDDGMGGCGDFKILAADITEMCAFTASTRDRLLTNVIDIAPNPFSDQTTITIEQEGNERFTLSLQDVSGRVLWQMVTTDYQINLERDNLPAGMYFVKIQDEAGKFTARRVVIQ